MKRVQNPVRIDEAIRRAVTFLAKQPLGHLCKASQIAYIIWPGERFLAGQGAGAAASRILKRAEKLGLVCWTSSCGDWGYKATSRGRALYGNN